MCGNRGAHAIALLPFREFALGHRLKKFGAENKLTLPGTGLAFPFYRTDWNQPRHWLFASGDDDLFTLRCPFDQLGEICLGLVNGYGWHTGSLAKSS